MTIYEKFIKGRFSGQDVHVVGSGPSLYGFDYSFFKGRRVIAINHAYKETEHDFKVFNDSNFVRREDPEAVNVTLSLCPKSVYKPSERVINYHAVPFRFTPHPGDVYGKGESGCTALCIAIQGGARRIFLWGLDYTFASLGSGELLHHSTAGKYAHRMNSPADKAYYDNARFRFEVFKNFDNIFNCSDISILNQFPKLSMSEVIDKLREPGG